MKNEDSSHVVNTSEMGGVLGRVGAGVGEAEDCCDSGCGVDDGSVLERAQQVEWQLL